MYFENISNQFSVISGDIPSVVKGDIVTSKSLKWPWQTHFIADPNDLEKVPQGTFINHVDNFFWEEG